MRRQYTQFEWRITLRIRTFHPAFERIFELRIKGDSPSRHWDGALFWCLHATVSWPTAAFGLCPAVSFLEENISKLLFVDLPKHMSDSEHAGQCWHTIHISINLSTLSSQSITAMDWFTFPAEVLVKRLNVSLGLFTHMVSSIKLFTRFFVKSLVFFIHEPKVQDLVSRKHGLSAESNIITWQPTMLDESLWSWSRNAHVFTDLLEVSPLTNRKNTCLKLWFSPIWYSWIRGQ